MTTLLVPDLERGHGTGHIRRCVKLLSTLPEAVILIPNESSSTVRGRDELDELLSGVSADRIVNRCENPPSTVVFDLFDASADTILEHSEAVTIGLDIGGTGRQYCSYVVDALQRLGASPANLTDLGYLDLPDANETGPDAQSRILVTFGGEDPAGLTESTVKLLVGRLGIEPGHLTVVRPGLRRMEPLPPGVESVGPLPSLLGVMKECRWVICSYGLTAFEAAAAGRSVITVAPTGYHDRLAARAGFVRAGVQRPGRRRLRAALANPVSARRVAVRMRDIRAKSLPELIVQVAGGHVGCPAHRGSRGRAVWRNAEKSYFCCPVCGTVYQERFRQDEESYGPSYFADEYKGQYGKTYLEDFDAIKQTGHRRLRRARALNSQLTSVLDIGCAYGPFLQAAAEAGMQPYGIDVSDEAIAHVTGVLKLPAVAGSVMEVDPVSIFGRELFDMVTLWYVIEHFSDLGELLARVSPWVKPGGVLAIATPNLEGVSGRRNTDSFFAQSPRDHHTIWSAGSAVKLLSEFGFRIRRVVSTGHHSERYPLVQRGILPRAVALGHSRLFGWGDTFELYAERIADERSRDA